jgi:glycosyltransferase involved in cell wall biosynthesis
VLQVLGSSAGGVRRHVLDVAVGAARRGAAVVVAGPAELGAHLDPARTGARHAVLEIRDRPGPGDLVALVRLRRLAAGADVVHAHGLRAGALSVLAARSVPRGPAVVVTLHNLPVGGRGVLAIAGVLERVVAAGADTVLGVSGDLVERAAALGARHTARALVPAPPRPAADRGRALAALAVPSGAALVVTVARLAPQKGLDLLCDTAALLRDVPLHWVVAGDGPLGVHLAQRAVAEHLPVEALGRREDVADLMAAADLVVSTALWEGQPLGIQEALALGAAVVATDVGGTREVTGDAAVLVPPDARALADAVRSLLGDPSRIAALRAAATARAAGLPDLDDTLDQLVAVWTAAVLRRAPRRPAPKA